MTPAAPGLAGLGTAAGSCVVSQPETLDFLTRHYGADLRPGARALLRRVFGHPGVRRRGFAFNHPSDLLGEDADRRSERFARSAVELAARASRSALSEAGTAARDVRVLVVNTCTDYLCPGLSSYLIEELGLERSVRAFDLVGAGCAGAIPNLELARAAVADGGGPALCVAVEICSCAFRMGDDPSLIVSNALFGDGAAAVVLSEAAPGLRLLGIRSLCAPEHREAIRFVYRGGQLHNQLARELPGLAADAAARVVSDLLGRHGLRVNDIAHWAVHPGGAAVLDAVRESLGLPEAALAASREVLADRGNLSSATVLFVLDALRRRGMRRGERVALVSFGAGLTAHAALLAV